MKVYVKDEEKRGMFFRILIPLAFSIVSIILIIEMSIGVIQLRMDNEPLTLIIVCAIWGYGLGIDLFLISYIYWKVMLKSPGAYKAILLEKEEQIYKENKISYMLFSLAGEENPQAPIQKFYCYTIGQNDFIVNNIYTILIKEVNWQILSVEELNDKVMQKSVSDGNDHNIMNILGLFCIFFIAPFPGIIFLIAGLISVFRKETETKEDIMKYLNKTKQFNEKKIRLTHEFKLGMFAFITVTLVFILFYIIPYYSVKGQAIIDIKTPMLVILIPTYLFIIIAAFKPKNDNDLLNKYSINANNSIYAFEKSDFLRVYRLAQNHSRFFRNAEKDEHFRNFIVTDKNNVLLYRIKDEGVNSQIYNVLDSQNRFVGIIEAYNKGSIFVIKAKDKKPYAIRIDEEKNIFEFIGKELIIDNSSLSDIIICNLKKEKLFSIINANYHLPYTINYADYIDNKVFQTITIPTNNTLEARIFGKICEDYAYILTCFAYKYFSDKQES